MDFIRKINMNGSSFLNVFFTLCIKPFERKWIEDFFAYFPVQTFCVYELVREFVVMSKIQQSFLGRFLYHCSVLRAKVSLVHSMFKGHKLFDIISFSMRFISIIFKSEIFVSLSHSIECEFLFEAKITCKIIANTSIRCSTVQRQCLRNWIKSLTF